MSRDPDSGDVSANPRQLPHRAARIEDAFHQFREVRARRRGLIETVIPYAGYGGAGWIRVLGRVLLTKPAQANSASRAVGRGIRGWRSFTSVPVNEVAVTIIAGGVEHRVMADRGGVVDTRVEIDLPAGWNSIELYTDESLIADAPVYVVDETVTFGLVSDIDDTVMVTALPRPLLAAWNTFVLNEHARRPVPGMAVLYERLAREHPGAPVVYLSTGAWNVAPTLTRFLSRNLYPAGALLLTDWGPTHDRLFRSGRQHKQESLRRLQLEFPDIKWLLVGDDGQHDEELYGEFARAHPENVRAVCIRQLSTGEAVFAGGRSSADAHGRLLDTPWLFAPDGAGLSELLTAQGILPEYPR
jgi:phosphatidate phosphatase APP1